jgi:rod shape-determining protein MreC
MSHLSDLSTGRRKRPARSLLAVLTLASLTVITVDYQRDDSSPFESARTVLGDVLGPVQETASVVARPIQDIPGFFEANQSLRADIAKLQAENANLRGQVATTSEIRYRAAELDGLLEASKSSGFALVPARVVAVGPAQSFSQTVTIDAGTSSGIHPDMTVVNNQGLVGRVIDASHGSATVLLVIDQHSVVGARLGSNAEVGFLSGRGEIGGDGRLDLDLVDNSETPGKNDVVVTWGSRNGAPYVQGVPIGSVEAVFSSPREQSKQAVIKPFVDFSSLDLVGVVVNGDTEGDRPVIKAGELPDGEDH